MAKGKSEMINRTGTALALAAWVGLNVVMLARPVLGANYTSHCEQLMVCTGTTQPCTICDMGLQDSCDMWSQTSYGGIVMKGMDGGTQHPNDQGPVVCYTVTDCGDGNSSWLFLCYGRSVGCQVSPILLQYCTQCTPNGTAHPQSTDMYVCTDGTEE